MQFIRLVYLIFLTALTGPALASEQARVMAIGTFHFKDAGLDVAKVEDFNVMTAEPQLYLEKLADQMAAFKPTAVLLEYNPENEIEMNQRYAEYLAGTFELPTNETYQLGFRIARAAGLENVSSFDHRQVPWQAEPLFEYAKVHDSPEMKGFQSAIDDYMATEAEARKSMDLGQLLLRHNDKESANSNMDLYLLTNPVGVNDGWSGADSTASWWHRNFRMYAKIQKHATPGARVIVIGGSGHIAIIRNLLEIDSRISSVDPAANLEAARQ